MCRLLLSILIFSLDNLIGLAGTSPSTRVHLPFLTSQGVPDRAFPGFSYAGHVKLHPRSRAPHPQLARGTPTPHQPERPRTPSSTTPEEPPPTLTTHTFVRLSRSGSVFIGSQDTLLPPDWSWQQAEAHAAGHRVASRHGSAAARQLSGHQHDQALMRRRRLAKVFPPDDRVPVENTTQTDWRVVGQLDMEEGPRNYTCTATLIGPRWVLTAAHCVYSTDTGEWLAGLDFAPARYVAQNSSMVSPYGVAKWKHVTTYLAYMASGLAQYDLALITLDVEIGNTIGWMQYGQQCGDQQLFLPVSLVGFPGDKLPGSMWMSNCTILIQNCLYSMIFHQCDTYFGMSGSPLVFIDSSGNHTIQGIHVGQNSNSSNVAVALKPLQVSHIKSWIAADVALLANGTNASVNTSADPSDPSLEATGVTGGAAVHTVGAPADPSQGGLGPVVHEPLHVDDPPPGTTTTTVAANGMPEPMYNYSPMLGAAGGAPAPAKGAGGQGQQTTWPQQVVIAVTVAAGCVLVAALLWGVALGMRWANRRRDVQMEVAREGQRAGAVAAVGTALGAAGDKREGARGGGQDVEAAAGDADAD